MFEMYDRDGRYLNVQDRAEYSHDLEIRLKSGTTIDFEALPSTKQLKLVVNAVAKSETEIRRLVHSSEVDAALVARDSLNTPSSLTVSITVTGFDERPVVVSQYDPTTNHRRGFLLRMNADGGKVRIRGDSLFPTPKSVPCISNQIQKTGRSRSSWVVRPISGLEPSASGAPSWIRTTSQVIHRQRTERSSTSVLKHRRLS